MQSAHDLGVLAHRASRMCMCPSVDQNGGLAGLNCLNGYPALSATRQDAGLAISCTSMISRIRPALKVSNPSCNSLDCCRCHTPAAGPDGSPVGYLRGFFQAHSATGLAIL